MLAVIIQSKPFCIRKITDTERLFLFFETDFCVIPRSKATRNLYFILLPYKISPCGRSDKLIIMQRFFSPIKTGGNIFSGWIKWKK
ncbi:MAG: hypothetical protein CVU52_05910 [Deltaproteobacteria bacterium HGW-Deltaproteobacteria-10]|nr:MAG: hypothetical protein CVU62_02970 [Deltaproteobacteria bacterium HGW-Deltaproteobacteria-2]PKN75534.1 MAG: hypothetical protein CVU52_05910 [Deltaproteobacteria bacterium HGW-Deltaproteobacteria-10]